MKISYVAQNGVFSEDISQIRGHLLQKFLSLGHQVEVVSQKPMAPGFRLMSSATGDIALIEGAHPLDPKVKDTRFAASAVRNVRSTTYIHWDPQTPKPNQPWKTLKTFIRGEDNSARVDFSKCVCESLLHIVTNSRSSKVLVKPRKSFHRKQLEFFFASDNFLIHDEYAEWISELFGDQTSRFANGDFFELATQHEFVYLLANSFSIRAGNIPYEFFLALAAGSLPLLDDFDPMDAKLLLGPIGPRLCVHLSTFNEAKRNLERDRIALIGTLRAQILASKPTDQMLQKLFWVCKQANFSS